MQELWLVNLERSGPALESFDETAATLDAATVARLDKLADARTRQARRWAHLALRQVLNRYMPPQQTPAPFVISKTGRPTLEGGAVDFSLSHADGWALIGLTDRGQIGVDLEPRARAVRLPDTRRAEILNAGRQLLNSYAAESANPDEAFLASWVCLEAYAKAIGVGVGRVLESIRGLSSRRQGKVIGAADNQQQPSSVGPFDPKVRVAALDVGPDLVAAVAQTAPLSNPVVTTFPVQPEAIRDRFQSG
jgi:4'-phosphopantetheinyl transferase